MIGHFTFLMAMVEAISYLTLNPNSQVLLTMSDAYAPDFYKDLKIENNHEYALSLLLSGEGDAT